MDSGREQWDTFCFIGPHALLITNTIGYGSLNVFFFDDPHKHDPPSLRFSDIDSKSQFRHVLTLHLPETVHPHAIAHIAMRSEPPPSGRSIGESSTNKQREGGVHSAESGPSKQPPNSQSNPRLFYADPEEAVIILTIDYLVPPRRPRNRVPAQLIPHLPMAGPAQPPTPVPAPSTAPPSSEGSRNVVHASHQYLQEEFVQELGQLGGEGEGTGPGAGAGAGIEVEEAPTEQDEENEGWGDGPALVVDGFQISLAHPQVVALRRKDVMRWARTAEGLHRRREHEARAAEIGRAHV